MLIPKKTIAILFGGQSTEYKISLYSVIYLIRAIDKNKYNILLIKINKLGKWYLCDINNILNENKLLLKNQIAIILGNKYNLINTKNNTLLPKIDVVFPILHGFYGESGSVQGLLNLLNIPYVSTDIIGSSICIDKDITKRLLKKLNINVTPFITLYKDSYIPSFYNITKKLKLPWFVKPARHGSSIGISKINNEYEFINALKLAFNLDKKILVEQLVNAREIEIGIIGNKFPKVSACGEIITNNNFYSYYDKYINNKKIKLIIPAKLNTTIVKKIKKLAIKIYLLLGCNIMARIDFFLQKNNNIIVNEINTIPGFTNDSMFPKLFMAKGLSYSKLIDQLILLAIQRHKSKTIML
ncbi:MAG: D-alanine--D-alanine ligase [Candidatus Lightella neohaematopini]|nr:D-alanine--D-alanine ligase [Candidatus Lightella neohaematopini]